MLCLAGTAQADFSSRFSNFAFGTFGQKISQLSFSSSGLSAALMAVPALLAPYGSERWRGPSAANPCAALAIVPAARPTLRASVFIKGSFSGIFFIRLLALFSSVAEQCDQDDDGDGHAKQQK